MVPGDSIALGVGKVTLIYGKGNWSELSDSENNNAISIAAKYEYDGKSILFTGDTVGRRLNDVDSACKDAEFDMVQLYQQGLVNLKTDVLIAAHHGANNANSSCFINAAKPLYVIFSAGHKHGHPSTKTVNRFVAQGISLQQIYRTDLNDAEQDNLNDWEDQRLENCVDVSGDDDIEIRLIKGQALPLVGYRNDGNPGQCKS